MNALEAASKVEELKNRADALERVIYYLRDNKSFDEAVYQLAELRNDLSEELSALMDKLRAVQL